MHYITVMSDPAMLAEKRERKTCGLIDAVFFCNKIIAKGRVPVFCSLRNVVVAAAAAIFCCCPYFQTLLGF